MTADQLGEAINSIYDVTLDASLWPAVLETLAKLFNSTFADTFQRTVDYQSFRGTAYGLDERDYQDVFLGVWVKRNVWGKRRPIRTAGDVLTTREMMPIKSLLRTDMYQDYLKPRGLHEGLRLDTWAAEGWVEDISLLRPWSAGPYTQAEKQMARTLLPHLQRVAAMTRRLVSAEGLAAASMAAFDALQASILILDRHGRLMHANPAASAMLAAADGLALTATGLYAATPVFTSRLSACIAAAAGSSSQPARSGALILPRPSGLPGLSVIAQPLRPARSAQGLDLPGHQAVLLCVYDSRSAPMLRRQTLASVFRLTPAETALADDLLDGDDLRAIAAKRQRSINTIRTHLAGLMAKTDTRRQAELVSFLAKLQLR